MFAILNGLPRSHGVAIAHPARRQRCLDRARPDAGAALLNLPGLDFAQAVPCPASRSRRTLAGRGLTHWRINRADRRRPVSNNQRHNPEEVVMSQFRWLVAAGGGVVGLVALTFAHTVSAHLQPPGGQIQPSPVMTRTCNVSPAFGAFKGVWEEWLVFEDAAGTLRSVDDSCQVRQTIRRQ